VHIVNSVIRLLTEFKLAIYKQDVANSTHWLCTVYNCSMQYQVCGCQYWWQNGSFVFV